MAPGLARRSGRGGVESGLSAEQRLPGRLHPRLADEETTGNTTRASGAACALTALGEPEEAILLENLARIPAAECRNLILALGPARERVIPALLRAVESDPQGHRRIATLLLFLGNPEEARRILAPSTDPNEQIAFLDELQTWHGDLVLAARLLRQVDDPGFRQGLCLAFGQKNPAQLLQEERDALVAEFARLYREAPDGETHSAAWWCLRQWDLEVPTLPEDMLMPRQRGWYATRHGLTMIRLKTPAQFVMGNPEEDIANPRPHSVRLTRPFCMADREVTVRLFQSFLAQEKPGWKQPPNSQAASPAPDCPMQGFTRYEAMEFCNWLSRQDGRTPCYRRTDRQEQLPPSLEKPHFRQVDVWECDFDADGYRFPTEAEWEYACRAGTTTRYFFGGDDERLPRYGHLGLTRTAPVCSRLPNPWGFFDMLGNVHEHCWDRWSPFTSQEAVDPVGPMLAPNNVLGPMELSPRNLSLFLGMALQGQPLTTSGSCGSFLALPNRRPAQVQRGGYWSSYHKDLYSGARYYNDQSDVQATHVGIRLVRTLGAQELPE